MIRRRDKAGAQGIHLGKRCDLSGIAEAVSYTHLDVYKRQVTSISSPLLGRGDVIRTHGLYVPNVALYQTEPHLDSKIKPRNIKNTGADSWLRN